MSDSPINWLYYTDTHGRTYVYLLQQGDLVKCQSRIAHRAHVGRLDLQAGKVSIGKKFLSPHPRF